MRIKFYQIRDFNVPRKFHFTQFATLNSHDFKNLFFFIFICRKMIWFTLPTFSSEQLVIIAIKRLVDKVTFQTIFKKITYSYKERYVLALSNYKIRGEYNI